MYNNESEKVLKETLWTVLRMYERFFGKRKRDTVLKYNATGGIIHNVGWNSNVWVDYP